MILRWVGYPQNPSHGYVVFGEDGFVGDCGFVAGCPLVTSEDAGRYQGKRDAARAASRRSFASSAGAQRHPLPFNTFYPALIITPQPVRKSKSN